MSLISLHCTQALESIMVILLSIVQGNTCTAKDDCGWCSLPFLMSVAKTWGFDKLRVSRGCDSCPLAGTALDDDPYFWDQLLGPRIKPPYLCAYLCFSHAFSRYS